MNPNGRQIQFQRAEGQKTLVTTKSPMTNQFSSFEIDMPITAFLINFDVWLGGAHIQDVFPMLDTHQREMMITGYTKEDWNKLFEGGEPC